jgi:hypothetical protein
MILNTISSGATHTVACTHARDLGESGDVRWDGTRERIEC